MTRGKRFIVANKSRPRRTTAAVLLGLAIGATAASLHAQQFTDFGMGPDGAVLKRLQEADATSALPTPAPPNNRPQANRPPVTRPDLASIPANRIPADRTTDRASGAPVTPSGKAAVLPPPDRGDSMIADAYRKQTPPVGNKNRSAAEKAKSDKKEPPRLRRVAATLPSVLSIADLTRYEKIFALQKDAKWEAADAEIRQLEDPLLLGYVLRQRYLHKCCYKATYAQLVDWMKLYGDHLDADRVYRLAMKRRPRRAARPKRPWGRISPQRFWLPYRTEVLPLPRQSRQARRQRQYLARLFKRAMKRDHFNRAMAILNRKDAERLFGAARYDKRRLALATRLFHLGRTEKAFSLANPAAERSGRYLAGAHWVAGLTAWQLLKFDAAAKHFEKVATAKNESSWLLSAGAFWAGRAHTDAKRPEEAKRWFIRAATHSRTFYGVLARRRMGLPMDFDWRIPEPREDHMTRIMEYPQARRALALAQLGRNQQAGEAFLRSYFRQGQIMSHTYLALAAIGRMPEFSLGLSKRLYRRTGERYDGALYPVPEWAPGDGFKLDRAMIYAIARQESAFKRRATSHAGARGLMQLMPATAAFIGRDRSLRRRAVSKLYDPTFNLTLGQRFFIHLLERPAIKGNLFFAIASYNAGEGNLNKFRVRSDPLLFIEAMHLRETRLYVEKVLYNLWAYRTRLKQPTPSLDALARGEWPFYVPQDPNAVRLKK